MVQVVIPIGPDIVGFGVSLPAVTVGQTLSTVTPSKLEMVFVCLDVPWSAYHGFFR